MLAVIAGGSSRRSHEGDCAARGRDRPPLMPYPSNTTLQLFSVRSPFDDRDLLKSSKNTQLIPRLFEIGKHTIVFLF
jgi:hypothetical protein